MSGKESIQWHAFCQQKPWLILLLTEQMISVRSSPKYALQRFGQVLDFLG